MRSVLINTSSAEYNFQKANVLEVGKGSIVTEMIKCVMKSACRDVIKRMFYIT